MGVKRYLSVGGQLLAEYQVDTDEYIGYMSDALGNVSSTVGSGGDKVNEYLYSPFGEMVKKTGTYPDPKYLWCGTWGYRANGNKWVSHYVRARHYSFADAAWTSVDPLWPSEMPYGYVEGRVMTGVDYWGLQVGGDLVRCIESFTKLGYSARSACKYCKKELGYKGGFKCESQSDNGFPVEEPSSCGAAFWSSVRKLPSTVSLPKDHEKYLTCVAKCFKKPPKQWASCQLKCAGADVVGPAKEALLRFSCCNNYAKGLAGASGKDPCSEKYYDPLACCDVKWCTCFFMKAGAGLPNNLIVQGQICESEVKGDPNCDNYEMPYGRNRIGGTRGGGTCS